MLLPLAFYITVIESNTFDKLQIYIREVCNSSKLVIVTYKNRCVYIMMHVVNVHSE